MAGDNYNDILNKIGDIEDKLTKQIETIKIDNVEIKTNQKNMADVLLRLADSVAKITEVQADIKILRDKYEKVDEQIVRLFDIYNKIYENGTSICKVREGYFVSINRRIERLEKNEEAKAQEKDKRDFQIKILLLSTLLGWLFSLIMFFMK
jgi:predicted phage tail protein